MIKFARTGPGGGTVFTLGLSAENCRRLLDGKPIHTTSATVGITPLFEVSLLAGHTVEHVAADLASIGVTAPPGSYEPGSVTVRVTELQPARPPRRMLFIGLTGERLDRMLAGEVMATVAAFDDERPLDVLDAAAAAHPVVMVCAGADNNDIVARLVDSGWMPADALTRNHNIGPHEPPRRETY